MVKEIFAVCMGFTVTKVLYTVSAYQVAWHELTGECRKLHNEDLDVLYSLLCVCTVTKLTRLMDMMCGMHEEWKLQNFYWTPDGEIFWGWRQTIYSYNIKNIIILRIILRSETILVDVERPWPEYGLKHHRTEILVDVRKVCCEKVN
jgi:hypothetical protein